MAASRERMLANAFIIIDEVERHGDLEGMTLGGGTSMMLQINHRVSRDIDFFLPDPQLIGFISVAAADVEAWLSGFGYRGDGRLFMKVDIGEGGQIDFIAAPPVTDHEPLERTILGRRLLLDSLPAIIAQQGLPPRPPSNGAGHLRHRRRVRGWLPNGGAGCTRGDAGQGCRRAEWA